MNYKSLSKLAKKELVNGLPKLKKIENTICWLCQQGKQLGVNHKQTTNISTNMTLEYSI